MVKVTQLVLLILGVWVVYYTIQHLNKVYPLKNDGSLIMEQSVGDGEMDYTDTQQHNTCVTDPWDEPIPGSPEYVSGGDIDRVNWEGLPESQLQEALSKQYQELTSDDLLPHNEMAHWADVYPNGVGQLHNKSFLHAGHHVGINTVGQHLKNPNLQLRSEPPNPQVKVSPWLNSSWGPDLTRRPLEIGCE